MTTLTVPMSSPLEVAPVELVQSSDVALAKWQEPGADCPRYADPTLLYLQVAGETDIERLLARVPAARADGESWRVIRTGPGRYEVTHPDRTPLLLPSPSEVAESLAVWSSLASALRVSAPADPGAPRAVWIEPNYVWASEPEASEGKSARSSAPSALWWAREIGVDAAWDAGVLGHSRIEVALFDSGVNRAAELTSVQWAAGVDCVKGSNDLSGLTSHGTTMARLIAARHDKDGAGVAPKTSIIPIRVLDNGSRSTQERLVCGIRHVAKLRATPELLNFSLHFIDHAGSPSTHAKVARAELEQLLRKATVAIVASSGWKADRPDRDLTRKCNVFPACFGLAGSIVVGAVTKNSEWRSHWGKTVVHLGAPGKDVAVAGRLRAGSSVATAITSGSAALLLAHDDDLSPPQIIRELRGNVKVHEKLATRAAWGGTLALEGLFDRSAP